MPDELDEELFAHSRKRRGHACGCEQLDGLDAVDSGVRNGR